MKLNAGGNPGSSFSPEAFLSHANAESFGD